MSAHEIVDPCEAFTRALAVSIDMSDGGSDSADEAQNMLRIAVFAGVAMLFRACSNELAMQRMKSTLSNATKAELEVVLVFALGELGRHGYYPEGLALGG